MGGWNNAGLDPTLANSRLRKYNVGDTGLTRLTALTNGIQAHTALERPDLSKGPLCDKDATVLIAMLVSNTSLEELLIVSCCLHGPGLEAVAAGIKSHTMLEGLDVSGNDSRGPIDAFDMGAKALGDLQHLLAANQPLKHVNVQGCTGRIDSSNRADLGGLATILTRVQTFSFTSQNTRVA
jgi:hypothetical protein